MATQTAPPPPASTPPPPPSRSTAARFWERVTEGFELSELWSQFSKEARSGYGLYSADVDWTAVEKEKGLKRFLAAARALAWTMLMKLTPARRVLLLAALVFLAFGKIGFQLGSAEFSINPGGIGVLILLMLLALELADRVTMKRDLEIAREIQQWLVPDAPPAVPGLDIAFATRPANTVAGDYYDAFFPDDNRGRLLLVVADVAGKSVPAALLMATFQASLHSSAGSCGSLSELVERLNRFACLRSLGGQRFTTAFLAELDPGTRAFTYVSAGHNAPVLRRVTGELERLERGGIPFGIDASTTYEVGRAQLERGDVLLIFTDGLIETVNERGEEYGEERLLNMLNAVPGESAGETIRHVIESADGFAGSARQHDDITCLVARAV